MRKVVALVLVVVLLLVSFTIASASSVDLSVLKDNSLIDVDIDNDGDAFVESIFGKTNFTHPKGLDDYPSYVYSDIIIGDYYSSNPVALWRFWVSYSAAKYLGITSMTIDLDGTKYTFKNVGSKDNMTDYGTNVRENPHITFGSENLSFWVALLLEWECLEQKTDMFDMSMKLTLHGSLEDVTVTIDGYAMADLCIIGETYLSMAGIEGLMAYEGNSMTYVSPE